MKQIVRIIFRLLARLILRRYHPVVIAIAGSVGKTATKDAIAAGITSAERRVRKTSGNFNAEIGVPATIMSESEPPTSAWKWLRLLWQGKKQVVFGGTYPTHLVLEMAADHPGDLQPLIALTKPSIGVLTSAAPEHLEYFGTEDGVVAEESLIVRKLTPIGTAVVNVDDPRIVDLVPSLSCRVISYGWQSAATVRAENVAVTRDKHGLPNGMIITVHMQDRNLPITLPGVYGRHQAYPILATLAVAQALGDDPELTVQRLSAYVPPAGRMRLFAGLAQSLIIDDSYNSSPEAVQAALRSLHELDVPGKRIAVLGQMSELGSSAVEWHDRIGREIAKLRIDVLVTVGTLAERIGTAAIEAGMPKERINYAANAEAAAAIVQPMLSSGMAVLIKGSRFASRLERTVAILLDNPERDKLFLVQEH